MPHETGGIQCERECSPHNIDHGILIKITNFYAGMLTILRKKSQNTKHLPDYKPCTRVAHFARKIFDPLNISQCIIKESD